MSDFDFKLFKETFTKQFGKDSLTDLMETPEQGEPGTFIPTPSQALNKVLGVGGLPVGRVIELFGDESSGKSTLALECVAAAQKAFPKLPVAYIDAENAVTVEYAKAIGVDMSAKRFLFVQEGETEKALDMAHNFAKAGVSMVVLDSVAALISKRELEAQETTESRIGGNAKALSSAMRFIVSTCAKSGTIMIAINQLREKVGVVFGNPETTTGGRALRFYSSVRLRTSIKEQLKDKNGEVVGVRVKVKCVKNKVAPPYRTGEYNLLFGEGIDRIGDLIDTSVEEGTLTKAGSHYVYAATGEKLANGREAMRLHCKADEAFTKELTESLWKPKLELKAS